MQKIVSLRPSQDLLELYAAIQVAEPEYPEKDRNSISARALEWFNDNQDEEIIREAVNYKLKKAYYLNGELPSSFKITLDMQSFELLEESSKIIRETLSLKRTTITYVIKIVLRSYLLFLKKLDFPEVNIDETIYLQDLLLLKASFEAYSCEKPEEKQTLLDLSRAILEHNTEIYTKLREKYAKKCQLFSSLFLGDEKHRSDFGKPNIRFLMKALAGFFLIQAEIQDEADIMENAIVMAQEALNEIQRKKQNVASSKL